MSSTDVRDTNSRNRWRFHALGLLLTTATIYTGHLAYQCWSDYEERLSALESQVSHAAPPEVKTIPETWDEIRAGHEAREFKRRWAPGMWEMQADAYLKRHAYEGVSAATPPPHRARIHD